MVSSLGGITRLETKAFVNEICESFLNAMAEGSQTSMADFAEFHAQRHGPAPARAWEMLRRLCRERGIDYEHPVKIVTYTGKPPMYCCGHLVALVNGQIYEQRAHMFNRGTDGFSDRSWRWHVSQGSRKSPTRLNQIWFGAIEAEMNRRFAGRCCGGCLDNER